MSSRDLVHKLDHFSVVRNDESERRIENFMEERETSRRQRRRQSVSQHFTTERYYNLVRAHPVKVFESCSFREISRVFEVQVLQQSSLDRQKHLQQATMMDSSQSQSSYGRDHQFNGGAGQGVIDDSLSSGPLSSAQLNSNGLASDSTERGRERPSNITDYGHPDLKLASRGQQAPFNDHLQSLRDLSMSDSLASSQQSPLLNELMPL